MPRLEMQLAVPHSSSVFGARLLLQLLHLENASWFIMAKQGVFCEVGS
jgi:hypothetical protein